MLAYLGIISTCPMLNDQQLLIPELTRQVTSWSDEKLMREITLYLHQLSWGYDS